MNITEFNSIRVGDTVNVHKPKADGGTTLEPARVLKIRHEPQIVKVASRKLGNSEYIKRGDLELYHVGENAVDPKGAAGASKAQLQLLPPTFNVETAAALSFGAAKYGEWNWREANVEIMTYLGAMKRHIDQLLEGEWVAEDSNVTHLGHIAASCAIMLDADDQGTLKRNLPINNKK